MEYNKSNNYNLHGEVIDFPATFAKVMRNVYGWMSCGLLMTALTAMVVAGQPDIIYAIATSKLLMWGLFGAEIGLVLWLTARINSMSSMTAGLMFAAYAILNGVTMSFIFLAYTMESIASTFFITAGTFAAMSAVGYFTKKDLSGVTSTQISLPFISQGENGPLHYSYISKFLCCKFWFRFSIELYRSIHFCWLDCL